MRKNSSLITGLLVVIIVSAGFSWLRGTAQTQADRDLATKYAPKLIFTKDEKFYPTSVDYIVLSSTVKRRVPGGTPVLVDGSPLSSNLGTHSSTDLYLDNRLSTFERIAADYSAKVGTLGYHSYVHLARSGSSTVIQYWLFYIYNNGLMNDHQGDVEVIEVFLESGVPKRVVASQHHAGQNALWQDVEKHLDTHPVIYVAKGSHANFFRPYQGKIGMENDVVGSDGLTILPETLTITVLGERGSHLPEQSWLDFRGRWGYWGTDFETAQGMAGPLGPIDNQNGIRWAYPASYLAETFAVDANYFALSWVAANFVLVFLVYTIARGAWKVRGILKLRSEGLRVWTFLKSRGGIGVILGIAGILITAGALALPWYSVHASSKAGPISGLGEVPLMTLDGIRGLTFNFFQGLDGEATSGYRHIFSVQVAFSLTIAAGLVLLALDIIGVKTGKQIGLRFILGALESLTPFVAVFAFVISLPAFLPFISGMFPSQPMPEEVYLLVDEIAGNALSGTATHQFPVVGTLTVTWGFGVGAYLFMIAALVRIVAGVIAWTSPEIQLMRPSPSRRCSKCGTEATAEAEFCPSCGEILSASGGPTVPVESPRLGMPRPGGWRTINIILIVVILVAMASVLYVLFSGVDLPRL